VGGPTARCGACGTSYAHHNGRLSLAGPAAADSRE
jgi:hypothetical protein